ncbi:Vms1/Ankzf1 family peptidyl-tRNA hydrolase [Kribbella sancticallisti]|uniref:Vms1/Ankzf1 family peptidyl-tRNA hydrolase n=1 Tax=Kribbella sancticallisti TaxID=460087 RepID=A0ABN2DLW2_9ACTN
MTILSGIDDTPLTKLLAGDTPVASMYFDQRPPGDVPVRWRTVARLLSEQGAPTHTIDALAEHVLDAVPGPGQLAAFAQGDKVTLTLTLPEADAAYIGRYGALPHLKPLLAWEQEHPARIVATLDRTGADISVYPAGSSEPQAATVNGPDDEIERNAPGGWSQGRYQNRAEDSWEHNSIAVAETVARLLKRFRAHVLFLAGDVRALQYLEEHLPRWIQTGVTVRRLSGGRSEDGSAARQSEQLVDQTRQIVAEQNAALLAEFAAHVGTGGLAVQGTDETFAALAAGRVRTLLLPTSDSDDRAWFGPAPTDLSLQPNPLIGAAGAACEAPLEDIAIRAALLTDADVRIVPDEEATFTIAALCRFTPTAA